MLFREQMLGEEGGDRRSEKAITDHNVISGRSSVGNSRAYSITRVKKDCDPVTAAAVMAGEMSANAAPFCGRSCLAGSKKILATTRSPHAQAPNALFSKGNPLARKMRCVRAPKLQPQGRFGEHAESRRVRRRGEW